MFFHNAAHPISSDSTLSDHPVLLLDRRFALLGPQYKRHRPCLTISKSPRGQSLPLGQHFRKPQARPDQETLYQRADGAYVPWLWGQDNEICFVVKMIHESCLHGMRWKSGKVDVLSGLDAESLSVVEEHVTRWLDRKQIRQSRTGPPDAEGFLEVRRARVSALSGMPLASRSSASSAGSALRSHPRSQQV
ncbi:hypothetical protein MMC34_003921 [Xylographa carneopallida]|nr:hypothetical protein [Xylographa carneopallida]